MRDYFSPPIPGLVIAPSRSGGTFLCHCLDSHYQITCERTEPFSQTYYWRRLNLPHRDLALALWGRVGYLVSMFKVSYPQFKRGHITLELLNEMRPKIIHLYRENALQVIISEQLCTLAEKGRIEHPIHTYEIVKQQDISLDCESLLEKIRRYLGQVDQMQKTLDGLEVLTLTYEQITTDGTALPDDVAIDVCNFLGVYNAMTMFSELTRLNYGPRITNFEEVQKTLKGTEFEWML